MNLILGLNAFHPDSSACVLKDGKLVAAVAEERLGSRHKHVAGFPIPKKCAGKPLTIRERVGNSQT